MQWHSHFGSPYLAYSYLIYKTFESTYLSNKLRNKLLGTSEKIPVKWRRNINEKIIFVARLRRHVSSKQSAFIRMCNSNRNCIISAVDHSRMAEGFPRIWEQHVHSASRPSLNVGGRINQLPRVCPPRLSSAVHLLKLKSVDDALHLQLSTKWCLDCTLYGFVKRHGFDALSLGQAIRTSAATVANLL